MEYIAGSHTQNSPNRQGAIVAPAPKQRSEVAHQDSRKQDAATYQSMTFHVLGTMQGFNMSLLWLHTLCLLPLCLHLQGQHELVAVLTPSCHVIHPVKTMLVRGVHAASVNSGCNLTSSSNRKPIASCGGNTACKP